MSKIKHTRNSGPAGPSSSFRVSVERSTPFSAHVRREAIMQCFNSISEDITYDQLRGWCLSHLRVNISEAQAVSIVRCLRASGITTKIASFK